MPSPQITLGWVVEQLQVTLALDGLENVVRVVAWRVNAHGVANGKDYFSTNFGTTEIGAPAVDGYVPFDSLTPEIVVGWVKEALGQPAVDDIEAKLRANIEEQANPTVITPPLPWE